MVKHPVDETTANYIVEDDIKYDLPNNFDANYTIGPCENSINGIVNVRNHIGREHWNPCDFKCNKTCAPFLGRRALATHCFIVPDKCNEYSDCPDIGKKCDGYLIPSFGCQFGICKYGPVLTRKGATMKNKSYAKRFESCKCERLNHRNEHFSSP